MKSPTTPCIVNACTKPSHIILYAQQRRVIGHWAGQPLLFCLRHADHILTLHRHADGRALISGGLWSAAARPAWAWIDEQFGWDLTELPTVWAPHHERPERKHTPWPAKSRKPSIPDRTPYPRRQR